MLFYRVLFLCLALFLGGAELRANPKKCTPEEIAKLARGGFTNKEIQEFCILSKNPSSANLREKYAMLEGKNWKTHYYLSPAQRQREEVFFEIGKKMVRITSSNPNVQYFEIDDLGDTLRFKRRQKPYQAIYILTLDLGQLTATELPVVQQYKKVRRYIWTAQ